MFKKCWKNWLFCALLLVCTNAATWHKGKIIKLFGEGQATGGAEADIGVLIPDSRLCSDEEENVRLAREYLSDNYHWVCVRKGKVPWPTVPFTEGTGFHFQPISKNPSSQPAALALR